MISLAFVGQGVQPVLEQVAMYAAGVRVFSLELCRDARYDQVVLNGRLQ